MMPDSDEMLVCAPLIREIGRGKDGARSLSEDDARRMYAAMLARKVSDLELGAILLSMRIKGESVPELCGFLQAAHESMASLEAPAGPYLPVLIPSYNGARNMANLTPLLAMLLAREGVPVLLHGVEQDPGRVTSCEIMLALGIPQAQQEAHLHALWDRRLPAFMSIAKLGPQLQGLLALRRILGLRNSTHSIVKLLQPFSSPALRLISYTHPEYQVLLQKYLATTQAANLGPALLMRATEGETVANARRAQQIECWNEGQALILREKEEVAVAEVLPEARDAQTTARWIESVLAGEVPVPAALESQLQFCLQLAGAGRTGGRY